MHRPFYRTCRQFISGDYANGGKSEYIEHKKFATEPEHYIRAFSLLQKDLLEIFDYIEPSDSNHKTFSSGTHELP
jgi:hypothetical protein